MEAIFVDGVQCMKKLLSLSDVVDSLTADPALLFICIGSLMFTVTFFGCFGALRDNVRLLQIVS